MKVIRQSLLTGIMILCVCSGLWGCNGGAEHSPQQEAVTRQDTAKLDITDVQTAEISINIALIDTGIVGDAVNSENILPGWNYCTDSEDTMDTIGHGTSLAGLILGSEQAGLMGRAPEACIVPLVCQRMDEGGNTQKVEPEDLSRLIRDAVDLYDCKIINISAGVKTDYGEMKEAVQYADEKGVLIISCAGNEGNGDIYYPGGYPEVLCVGSANQELTGPADFSQSNETVDLLAPGEKVSVVTMKGNVMEVSGTSYAAAYVTAAAAKLWKQYPDITKKQLLELLLAQTVTIEDGILLSVD